MSKRLLLVLALICAGAFSLNAQTKHTNVIPVPQSVESNTISSEQTDAQIAKALYTELDGTFEVEVSSPNYHVMYTRTLLEMIQASRLPNQEVTFEWDQFTTIIIYPSSAIEESSSNN